MHSRFIDRGYINAELQAMVDANRAATTPQPAFDDLEFYFVQVDDGRGGKILRLKPTPTERRPLAA